MIKRNSTEWDTFINRLNFIKQKSNREVLCIKCWQMLNCKQKIKHLKQNPDHKTYLLTSTQYASEQKICELAQGYNKLVKKTDGQEYMISPFAPVNLPLLTEANFSQQMGMTMNPQQQSLRLTEQQWPKKPESEKSSSEEKEESPLIVENKVKKEVDRIIYSDHEPEMKRQKTSATSNCDKDQWRKNFVSKMEFQNAMEEIKDFKEKFCEVNKKLDAILKIQDFILNEIPDLVLDKTKILKSSPPLRSNDLVGKFLGQNRTINQGGSNASFGMNNNSIYKLLSQSGNTSNVGGNHEQMQILNQLRTLNNQNKNLNTSRYAQNLNAQISALGIGNSYGGGGQSLRELSQILNSQVSGVQSNIGQIKQGSSGNSNVG